ncbi:MAG TPA: hypothetical protein VG755_19885 [Nannocystaceae bacterium]|nr:hypothetical protein [Nannocystaceae bacterium]
MARIHNILATTIAFALCYAAFDAEAAKPRAKGADGKPFRLHFDSDLFGFTHYNRDNCNGCTHDQDVDNSFGFGIGRLTLADSTLNSMGIGFGYGFLDSRAFVGARFSLVVDGFNLGEDNKTTSFRSQFQPYFQWMFLPGSWVRPYVEARIGIGGSVIEDVNFDMGGVQSRTVRNSFFPFGGVGGGVHLFPVDYFSIDLGLNLTMAGDYAKTKTTTNNVTTETDLDNQAFVFNLAAMVGVSTYFGR